MPIIRFYALEVTAVCGKNDGSKYFVHVPDRLQDSDIKVAQHAMELMSNADQEQLQAALEHCETGGLDVAHRLGLDLLIRGATGGDLCKYVETLMKDGCFLHQVYAAIAAQRYTSKCPDLLSAAECNDNKLISRFAAQMLAINRARLDHKMQRHLREQRRAERRQRKF